jgi:Fe-S-cluster-containing hydrogenase component 2
VNIRPQETPPSFDGFTDDPLLALRRLDLFRTLSKTENSRLARVAKIERIDQDRVIPRAAAESKNASYCFLAKGQVAFAEFRPGTIPVPPKNRKKRVQPTMQVAKRNITLFETGDFFTNDHAFKMRDSNGERVEAALYTCVPCVVVKIPKRDLDKILEAVPSLADAISLRAEESYYRQSFLKIEDRRDIFDFYVKEGLEYAKAVKVIQSDKCIDCDECVQACEDRHGVSRIERFGPQIGLIQFTLNCRTCADARCISPCNFDAIGFDEEEQEVIVYDNCVGCTLCAKACPHEAIRMVDIAEPPDELDIVQLAKRSAENPGTIVAEGETKKKRKKPKRIANKCDHCLGYEDMACITACPTGAIVQIDPRALFRRDGGLIERADKFFDPRPFEVGLSHVLRAQGVRFMFALLAVVGAFTVVSVWEYIARKFDPSLSMYAWLSSEIVEMGAYSSVRGMGRWMGYFGASMMIVAALYTLRLNVPGLRRIGSSKTWFDFHVVFGLAGPVFALLHMDLKIFETRWVTLMVWWPTFVVVITGLIGRFIYTAIPKAEFLTTQDKRKLDDGIKEVADQWTSLTVSANVMNHFLKAQEKQEEKEQDVNMGLWGFTLFLIRSEFRRRQGVRDLKERLLSQIKNKSLRVTALKLMTRRAQVERRTQILGVARRLLTRWRAYHIGISIFMLLALLIHIGLSIYITGI